MHEFAVARELCDLIERTVRDHHAGRVASARLLLGEMTCVDPETLGFAFEVACRGTVAEGCRLDIVRVPLVLRCRACGEEGATDPLAPCPACGATGYDIVQGREIRLDSIEVP